MTVRIATILLIFVLGFMNSGLFGTDGRKKNMEYHEIAVVGAGAAGLMCGYLLGKKGKDVILIDKNVSAGKKLLATGNGRCNFTNRIMEPDCYYGDREFIKRILTRVGTHKVIDLFEQIGVYHRERDGYCYPYSGQAASVVELLVKACEEVGVCFALDTKVTKIVHKEDGYEMICKNGMKYRCSKLVMASGGKANESLGGDGSGYKLCRSMKHKITGIYPGLTGLRAEGKEWKHLAGVRMQGKISLYCEGKFIKSDAGEIQIVKDGISGIPVFQLCRLAAIELGLGKNVTCRVDFFPEMTEEQLIQWLQAHGPDKLCGIMNRKWVDIIRQRAGQDIFRMVPLLKNYEVVILDTFGMEKAQVTAGGVDTREVCPDTMESNISRGLYIIGELLDVDGICGGYNLHFAWATAFICSEGFH